MIALKEERRQLEMWNVEADEEMMHEPQSWLSWLFGYFQVVKGGNSKVDGSLQNNTRKRSGGFDIENIMYMLEYPHLTLLIMQNSLSIRATPFSPLWLHA